MKLFNQSRWRSWLFLAFSVLCFTPAWSQVTMTLDPAASTINVGDPVTVTVKVDAGANPVDLAEVHLDFNPTILSVTSLTKLSTTELPVTLVPDTFNNVVGELSYGGANLVGPFPLINGNFDLLQIDFIAVGGGVSPISFSLSPPRESKVTSSGANVLTSTSGSSITVNALNSIPVITPINNANVSEDGFLQIPLSITDADGDNLTVTITSLSNEPQELQSTNSGKQVDPFPLTANDFFTQTGITSSAGAYSSSLDFSPVFGDGGSNGDGNAVYSFTITVDDQDGNSVTETFDLTVNDVDQVVSDPGPTRIEAESFDNQGPANVTPGSSGGTAGIGVEIDPLGFTNIGFTNVGDFVEYEIDVQTAGLYQFDFFAAVPGTNGAATTKTMDISSNGSVVGTFNPLATGGFGNYQTQTINVSLPAGPQTLRFDWTGGGGFLFNINYFELTLLPPDNPPTINAVALQELSAGALLTLGVTVTDDNNPAATIAIFDKSQGGTNSPFTPGTVVDPADYSWTDNGNGSYTLTWQTAVADARSYEARVTANDGVNQSVTEVFDINVAHPVPGIFLANTISSPTPWYGSNPGAGFSVSIEAAGNIGWVDAGEFIEYLIDVPSAGSYDIRLNSSNGSGSATDFFVFEEGNATALGSATVAANGWGTFTDFIVPITLANAGLQTLRIEFDGGTNTQEIELSVGADVTPPVITLLGDNPLDLALGGTYTDPGATANDNVDGDISPSIVVGGDVVDVNTPGTYIVTYDVDDAAGNPAVQVTRTVNVSSGIFQLCVGCGNNALNALGRSFVADFVNAPPTGTGFTRVGGKAYKTYAGTIAGTTPMSDEELLFQKEIYGGASGSGGANPTYTYEVPVPNGTYQIDLYFAEVFHSGAGGRIFDVSLEGNLILDEYDLVDPIKDGLSVNQTAITRTYYVNVSDGAVNIQIGDASVDNGKLSGFCVTEVTSANLMPTTAIGNLTADALVPAALALGINDPEGDALTVVLNGLPASLSYNSSTGQLEGTPLVAEAGTYTVNAIISDGTSSPITEEFSLVVNPPVDNPPSIAAIADVEIAEGGTASASITVTDDNNPAASIVIYDKSIVTGSSNTTPFTSNGLVDPADYTFTDNGGGSYSLSWVTAAGDGRSYLARVTADDGVNPVVTEDFTIDVAQPVSATIQAKTFANPLPWYGSTTPGSGYTVAIESNANQNVGYINAGDFVEYLVDVPTAGSYTFTVNAAKGTAGATTVTLSDPGGALGSASVTNNGAGWQDYADYDFLVILSAGIQTIRLDFSGGVNIQEFSFAPFIGNSVPVVQITTPADATTGFVGQPITFSGTANDPEDGDISANLIWTSSIDGQIGTGASFSGTLTDGVHTITAEATDSDPTTPETGTASISLSISQPAPACNVTYRVNAGGGIFADPNGNFEEDQAATNANANGTAVAGTPSIYYDNSTIDLTFANAVALVSNTTGYPDALFQTERYSTAPTMDWAFPLANGIYDVKLLFNENWTGEAANPRVFDVTAEGVLILDDYRPSGPTGADLNIAKLETAQVTVTDGELNISFIKGTQNPAIKGFDICFVSALNAPPVVTITAPSNGATIARGTLVSLTGTANDPEDGDISANLIWSANDPEFITSPTNTGAAIDGTFIVPGTTTLTADVTDSNGEPGTASVQVTVPGPEVAIDFPTAGSVQPTTNVQLQWTGTDVVYQDFDEHYHIYVNPADINNLDPNTRISTATAIGQEFWDLNAGLGIVEGTNTVVIVVADLSHIEFTNPEATDIITFDVADNTAPVITLTGADPQVITVGDPYTELGATALDNVDGDITANIMIDASAVDVNTIGNYQVTYNVSDAAGTDAIEVVRTVNVIPAPTTDVFLVATPATQTVNENDLVIVTVEVQANSTLVDYAEVHLDFDPNVLQVQAVATPGTAQLPTVLVPLDFDNALGTIDFGAGEFITFPSGTFDFIEVTFIAVGGPTTGIDFDLAFPRESKVTSAGVNALTGTVSATVDVIENPELVITPDLFTEQVGIDGTATNSFVVTTSDSNPLPGDLLLVSDQTWLTINGTNTGYDIDALGLPAGPYTATITASGTGYDDGFATVNLTVQAPPAPSVSIAVTPGTGLAASTFGGGSWQITNTGNVDITSVAFDHSTGILPDMVWDPVGTGGDATASCLLVGVGAVATGFVAPADPCTDPFSVPRQGGFDVATVSFTDFNQGEVFTFKSDNDPNSIQGVPGAGAAGAVSGFELIGATVTVTFADGTTFVGNLYEDGSLGGALLNMPLATSTAPAITLLNYPANPVVVPDLNQTVQVSGTPGEYVSLVQMDSRLFIATGEDPFNVTPVEAFFYANEAMAKVTYTAQIGAGGTVDIPVTLLQTAGAIGTPDGGTNQFIAVTSATPYVVGTEISATSNVLTVRYFPGYNPAAVVRVTPAGLLPISTFEDNAFEIENTGTVDILNVTIDLSTGFLMDIVFDPVGTAGDAGAKCMEPNDSIGTPGYDVPTDLCTTPFLQFHNGIDIQEGYDILTMPFLDFNAGEQFNFSVDIDPTSIKNDITTGDAGSVSGAELIGATVTILFADGTTITRCLWTDGSDGGAIAELTVDDLASPSISMQGLGTGPIQTSALSQAVDIVGPANADVQLLQWDTRLYIDAGSPNPYDIDPFEANETMAKVVYTGSLDANGLLSIPVTLLQTLSMNAGPDGGLNHFMAVVADTGLTSCMSNVIIVEVLPFCAVTAQTPVLCGDDAGAVNLTLLETAITTETGTFAYATGGTPIVDPTNVAVSDGQVIDVTFSGVNGCIEPVTITYTVNPLDTTNVAATTCDPAQVGVMQMVLTNQFGCDSTIITTTTLLPSDTTNVAATTCDPAQVGVMQMVLTNQFGCDSTVITTTTLLPSDTTNVAATTCDPAQVGVMQMVLTNQFGCDSTVITTTTLLPSDTTNVAATTCDPAQVGVMQMVLTNQFGCDSTVITTTTLLPSDTTNVAATTCDPAQVGVMQMVFTNQFGCDSTVITTTTLISIDAGLDNVTCNDSGTAFDPSDDVITFTLTPTGLGLGADYSVTGGGITPTVGTYGAVASFTSSVGAPGNGNLQVIVTDNASGCSDTIIVVDPGSCLGTPALTIDEKIGVPGYEVTVAVTAKGFLDQVGGQGTITWDPSIITFSSTGDIGFPFGDFNTPISPISPTSPGVLTFLYSDLSLVGFDLAEDDTLFTITFDVIGVPGDTSDVLFSGNPTALVYSSTSGTFSPLLIDGMVRIPFPAPISGAAYTEPDGVGTSYQVEGVRFSLDGPMGLSLTDGGGPGDLDYEFTVQPGLPYEIGAFKNNDSQPSRGVDVTDIIAIQSHLLTIAPFTSPYKFIAADVDHDGAIAITDIIQVQELILTIRSSFPSPTLAGINDRLWAFVGSDMVFPNPALAIPYYPADTARIETPLDTTSGYDFVAMKLGDVNTSWTPNPSGLRTDGDPVYFVMDEQVFPTEGIVEIPVRVRDFQAITGYQFTMEWDASQLEFAGIEDKGVEAQYNTQLASNGVVTSVWFDPYIQGVTLGNDTEVFTVKFRIKGTPGSIGTIKIGPGITPAMIVDVYDQPLRIETGRLQYTLGESSTSINNGKEFPGFDFGPGMPNPFTESIAFRFELPSQEVVKVEIYNHLGQRVYSVEEVYPSGIHTLSWDTNSAGTEPVAEGIYTVRFNAGSYSADLQVLKLD